MKLKILIIILLLSNGIFAMGYDSILKTGKDLQEINSINMHDEKSKHEYLLSKITLFRKYTFEEGKIFISKIIIGKWRVEPHSEIDFKKDGTYSLINYSTNEKKQGFWKITKNGISIRNDSKKWENKEINFFTLEKSDRAANKYRFYFLFKNDYEFSLLDEFN